MKSLPQVAAEYKKLFDANFPVDGMLSMLRKEPTIDMAAFERFLEEQGMDENDSMANFVKAKYGDKAFDFITNML